MAAATARVFMYRMADEALSPRSEARGIECVVAPAAKGVVHGFGTHSYILGLEAMLHILASAEKHASAR